MEVPERNNNRRTIKGQYKLFREILAERAQQEAKRDSKPGETVDQAQSQGFNTRGTVYFRGGLRSSQ
jgi:hypothetical protein